MDGSGQTAIDISPRKTAQRMESGDLLVIDVREQYEWDAGHVPGSIHIEMEEIMARADEVPADRPVAFLCLGGARSAMVASAFRGRGYDAHNVAGGFQAWFDQGLPTEPDGAEVAPH